MNKFAQRMLAGLIAAGAISPVLAHEPAGKVIAVDDFPAEERARMRDQVLALKQQAKSGREDAARTRDTEYAECWQRTLVSSCLERADEAYRGSLTAARRLETEAGDIERDIRRRSAEARRAEKQKAAAARRDKSIEMSGRAREQDSRRKEEREARAAKDAEQAGRAEAQAREQARQNAEQAAQRERDDARAAKRAADQRKKAADIDERVRKREEERARRNAEAAARAAAGKAP